MLYVLVWSVKAIPGMLEIMMNAAISEKDNLRVPDRLKFKDVVLDVSS